MNRQDEKQLPFEIDAIFNIKSESDFNAIALATFDYQLRHNEIYRKYCEMIRVKRVEIDHYSKIPFLPISFFKTHSVVSYQGPPEQIFLSSGTTGMVQSRHEIKSLEIYEKSFTKAFEARFGAIEDFVVFGLLPSYLQREGSSLVYMVDKFIHLSKHPESGFFLSDHATLAERIQSVHGKKVLLIGVAYALLDFGEMYYPDLSQTIVIETGGMKGKRKELIKSELHDQLKKLLNTQTIYSEYGMTELLSQAYSVGTEFSCPPWMKVLTRSYTDPFCILENKSGGLNVIDLANIYSCSFIATQDLGRIHKNYFEVLGRLDDSDIRGCNLLVQ